MAGGDEIRLGAREGPLVLGLFARNLRYWRIARKLTTKEASHRFGVSASTWSQWESGKRSPSVAFLPLLASLLAIPECSLLSSELPVCGQCRQMPPASSATGAAPPGQP
jgi:transcriptional regulator with XRE-family HTH domain